MAHGRTSQYDTPPALTPSGVAGRAVPAVDAERSRAVLPAVGVGAVVLVVLAALATDTFWAVTIVAVVALAAVSVATPLTTYVLLAVLVVVGVALLGQSHDELDSWPAVGIVAAVALVNGVNGARVRRHVEHTRGDLRFAIEAAGGLTHVTRLGSGLVSMDGDVEAVVGWPRDEWMTMDQFQVVHPDDHQAFAVEADDVVDGQVVDRIGRVRTKDGRWIWVRDVSRVVVTDDAVELHGFTVDVTAQQVGLDRVTTEATTDPLTGLCNRRALNAELARRSDDAGHHLVLIDLNRFKEVNDTLGHEAGDVLLRIVSSRLASALADDDVVARLGGDEFAIVLPATVATRDVVATVEGLAADVARPMTISGLQLTTSMSAGVVRAEFGRADRSTMLRHADVAMYTAKRRKQVAVVFDDHMGGELERRLLLSTEMTQAMAAGQIVLHHQPIVDGASGRVVGVEGLARWEHPQRGLLSPASFLDVILVSERSGEFTRHVVGQAIRSAAELEACGSDVTVAVNIPVRSLEDDAFATWLAAACSQAGTSPDRLVFEVAERDLHDAVATVTAIERFARLGVQISVDDFGTGHANFDRLRWPDVRQVKLDREIIRTVATDRRDGIIVRSIVDLAHQLDCVVVAEGVETEEQRRMLASFGCDLLQGHLFSPAVPFRDVMELLG